jgi:hypothetical protein
MPNDCAIGPAARKLPLAACEAAMMQQCRDGYAARARVRVDRERVA